MKNTIGSAITVTLFGESHGSYVGCVLDGLPSGFLIDFEQLRTMMALRHSKEIFSTGRHEQDEVQIISGVKNGYTEGTPLTILIANTDVCMEDYEAIQNKARPGHADYSGHMRYKGYEDSRGGGHFSGRLCAPLTAAGAILTQMLKTRGILIGTHISYMHGIADQSFSLQPEEEILRLSQMSFAVLDEACKKSMIEKMENARKNGDSLGGRLETAITGIDAGIGEPFFESVESRLSAAIFSIPGVKSVSFGLGEGFADAYGSEVNDPFYIQDRVVRTKTNYNGGVNGGITNGMPVFFSTTMKPTPSIAKRQETIDFQKMENTTITISGRHDAALVHRARIVVDAMSAITMADMLTLCHGRQWLCNMD